MSEDDLFLTIAALNLDADVSDAAFEAMSDSDKSVDAAVGEVLYLADNGAVWPPADGEWRERLRQPVLHAVEEANAAGAKAERARIVALLEAARDDARANFNSDRVDGLVQSANEEAAGAAMCNYLLNKVRQ